MMKPLISAHYVVLLSACVCVLVLSATPAGAIQIMTAGGGEGVPQRQKKSVVENLKQKLDNLDEGVKDHAQKKIIDPVKDKAKEKVKDKAKQAVKKGWNKLKNSKKFGPTAKKLAKKYGPAAKKISRLAGPAGRIMDAYGTGRTVGEKLNTWVLDPLTSIYYAKQQEELTYELEQDFAEFRRQLEEDRIERTLADLDREIEEMERAKAARREKHRRTQEELKQQARGDHYGNADFLSDMAEILIMSTVGALQEQTRIQNQPVSQPPRDPCEGRWTDDCSQPCNLCIRTPAPPP